MKPGAIGGEAAEDDARHRRRGWQRISHRFHGDARGTIGRKAIDAGGDRGKGNRAEIVRATERDRGRIAGCEQFVLAAAAAIPDRTDRMDDVFRGKPITPGHFRIARGAAAKGTAFGQKLRPRGAMDRAVDATPAKERRVRGVDDGVNAQCRDVSSDDFQPRGTNLARSQGSDRGVDRDALVGK
jgi:hypothetical protein